MKIDIWSDVVCPWCYIGKRRFEAGLAAAKEKHPDLEVDITYHAFQLDPTAPVGSGLKVRDVYEKKFGGPEKANEILEHVTSEAAGEGLDFKMDIAQRANTVLAHRMIALAQQQGLQHQMKERLLQAYFHEGGAIGLPEVLVDLAAEVGIERSVGEAWLAGDGGRAEVAADLELAADFGITAVPTFVFNEQFGVPGAIDAAGFERIFTKMYAHETDQSETEDAE